MRAITLLPLLALLPQLGSTLALPAAAPAPAHAPTKRGGGDNRGANHREHMDHWFRPDEEWRKHTEQDWFHMHDDWHPLTEPHWFDPRSTTNPSCPRVKRSDGLAAPARAAIEARQEEKPYETPGYQEPPTITQEVIDEAQDMVEDEENEETTKQHLINIIIANSKEKQRLAEEKKAKDEARWRVEQERIQKAVEYARKEDARKKEEFIIVEN